ncbi:MAG: hypothetical protein GY749_09680 [Desulfobacteraceae bacterium]|nr:hypothetical protein [Desulfobacteraceae bacterium]
MYDIEEIPDEYKLFYNIIINSPKSQKALYFYQQAVSTFSHDAEGNLINHCIS